MVWTCEEEDYWKYSELISTEVKEDMQRRMIRRG